MLPKPIKRRNRRGLRYGLSARLQSGNESTALEFRRMVAKKLEEMDMREADLAAAYGCSAENIRQIFDGGKTLRFDTAERMCRAMGFRLVVSLQKLED